MTNLDLPTDGMLWHYTSLDVLRKIVECRTLHATNIRYMNDAGEFKLAREHLLWLLNRQIIPGEQGSADAGKDDVVYALDQVKGWTSISTPPEVYVVCLSGAVNQLSQWRAYCREGPGVAIGFDMALLLPMAESQGFHLVECDYCDDKRYRELIGETVRAHLPDLRATCGGSSSGEQRTSAMSVARKIWADFTDLAARLKHEGFVEEREMRLVSTQLSDVNRKSKIRSQNNALVPYLPLTFTEQENPERFPAKCVWLGPTVDAESREMHRHAISVLAIINGLPLRDIRFCETPLRGR